MGDTMTVYAGEEQTVTEVEAIPDPGYPGQYLISNATGEPFCCEFSLTEHSYNILMPAGSFVIIDADKAEIFKESQSNDYVIFQLPEESGDAFYAEQYFAANTKEMSPHIVIALRYRDRGRLVSAALYPRDLEHVPAPMFVGADGNGARVEVRGVNPDAEPAEGKVEYIHHPSELEFILDAIHHIAREEVAAVDANAPKEKWF